MSSNIGFEVVLETPWEESVSTVTEALRQEGFGVLTRIDIHKAFLEKLGTSFRPYVILGACNPHLAHQALTSQSEVGLMLPCNVTLESTADGQTRVSIVDPEVLMQVGKLGADPNLAKVGADAKQRLRRVADALSAG